MNQENIPKPSVPQKPTFVVLGEMTFAEWDAPDALRDDGGVITIAQALASKAEEQGAQGTFFSDKPAHLSEEAAQHNTHNAAQKNVSKKIFALVARQIPTISWKA